VQSRWVWTRQLYYVTPPAPPESTDGAGRTAASQPPAVDPETRTTRG
jgi:hypothetical protein